MAVIIGKQEDKPQEQPEVEVKPEKESIIEYTGKKMGAGWQAVRPPQEEEYDASTAPFVAFTPPNDMGVMSKISYRNSAGNVEYMFNRKSVFEIDCNMTDLRPFVLVQWSIILELCFQP